MNNAHDISQTQNERESSLADSEMRALGRWSALHRVVRQDLLNERGDVDVAVRQDKGVFQQLRVVGAQVGVLAQAETEQRLA